jgi:predicted AAA+ superfamily ATPase
MVIVRRHVQDRVLEALEDTRVVVVQGARQVGKTTLVRAVLAERRGRLVTLDDPTTLRGARADPVGFLSQEADGLLAIDEVQRAPELILALKLLVDRDPRPGRFLLTGSADLVRLPAAEDSLAGRAERIELLGFSQGEVVGHQERFIDRLFAKDRFLSHTSDLTRHDLLQRAVVGSYPEALARRNPRRRNAWLDNYLDLIVERDAPDVVDSRRLADLPLVLRLLAARNSEELNTTDLSSQSGIPATSLARLLGLLETLYLVQRIPAWSTNLSKRVVSRPKAAILDSGLAARLVNVTAETVAPGMSGNHAGHLLEGFVAGELRRQLGWSRERVRISHYRDRTGAEVDFILETDDGRVAGIEVKASATVTASDTRWLGGLAERLGPRFVGGLVLYSGGVPVPFGERVTAVPLDVLWTA